MFFFFVYLSPRPYWPLSIVYNKYCLWFVIEPLNRSMSLGKLNIIKGRKYGNEYLTFHKTVKRGINLIEKLLHIILETIKN